MTTEEAFNIIKVAGQRNRNVALSVIKNNYSVMREVYEQLIRIVQQMISSPSELLPSTQSALTSVASRIQTALNPPSGTTQEQMVKKEGPVTTRTAETRGDNSDQHQSVEQTRPNGLTADTDQAHHNVCTAPTNNDHSTQDRTKSTGGDEGSDTGGAKSEREAEKSVIVTSPNIVQNNPVAAANDARKELTAAKSSFNDNRDTCVFGIVDDLLSIPGEIFKAVTKIDEDKDDTAEQDGDLESDNIFLGLVDSVTKELGKITLAISQFTADTALKKAELVIKNKTEKLTKIQERIEKMEESPNKEQYLEALLTMDLGVLFGDPASENKKKESIRDKDEEVNMAVKATEKALEAEANIN
jgi:hypothetical protein